MIAARTPRRAAMNDDATAWIDPGIDPGIDERSAA
jgi:hypothetical protein